MGPHFRATRTVLSPRCPVNTRKKPSAAGGLKQLADCPCSAGAGDLTGHSARGGSEKHVFATAPGRGLAVGVCAFAALPASYRAIHTMPDRSSNRLTGAGSSDCDAHTSRASLGLNARRCGRFPRAVVRVVIAGQVRVTGRPGARLRVVPSNGSPLLYSRSRRSISWTRAFSSS